ncbi:uncharacterized protein RJT20DRAFT_124128 [Scheffersomyces xylosifermentans]|uniref:uncharacterized protein n=1 Tax=Scheffersomyces xylosifermentans TaxID=1304137 RepID=UPI00315C6DB3
MSSIVDCSSDPVQVHSDSAFGSSFTADTKSSIRKRFAPRSGEQFKIGPPFDTTTLLKPVFLGATNEALYPILRVRIDRGFDFVNNEWIGYKRNYFTLVSTFEFKNKGFDIFRQETFNTIATNNKPARINFFAVNITSICCDDNLEIKLVQHTAKREHGSQNVPSICAIVPGEIPSHEIIKVSTNIRNPNKILQFSKFFYLDSKEYSKASSNSILSTYPQGSISTVVRYDRMQFASPFHHRSPTLNNKYFRIRIELLAYLSDGTSTIIAYSETPPIIVRGRAPSNYLKDVVISKTTGMTSSSPPQSRMPDEQSTTTTIRIAAGHSHVSQINNLINFIPTEVPPRKEESSTQGPGFRQCTYETPAPLTKAIFYDTQSTKTLKLKEEVAEIPSPIYEPIKRSSRKQNKKKQSPRMIVKLKIRHKGIASSKVQNIEPENKMTYSAESSSTMLGLRSQIDEMYFLTDSLQSQPSHNFSLETFYCLQKLKEIDRVVTSKVSPRHRSDRNATSDASFAATLAHSFPGSSTLHTSRSHSNVFQSANIKYDGPTLNPLSLYNHSHYSNKSNL